MAVRLDCLWQLIRIEPNPETVTRLLARIAAQVQVLESAGRMGECAREIARHTAFSSELREHRPDVADTLDAAHAAYSTPERAVRIVARAEQGDDGSTGASQMIAALGGGIAPHLFALSRGARARIVADLMVTHADLFAPPLADGLDSLAAPLRRVAARIFGLAGAGYELALSRLLKTDDEQTVREALRSLARIATPRAATLVAAEIAKGVGWIAGAAEQTLWHFPRAEADRQVAALLGARDFVLRQPEIAERLLDRTRRAKGSGVLGPIAGLRFRFWNPSVARVGRKAHALMTAR